jgi:hypothetical protein
VWEWALAGAKRDIKTVGFCSNLERRRPSASLP